MDIKLTNKQIKIEVYELDLFHIHKFPDYIEDILKCERMRLHFHIHDYVKNYVFKVDIDDKKYVICNFNRCEQSDDPINKIITCMYINNHNKKNILNNPVKYILNNTKILKKIKNKIEIHKAFLTLYTDFMDIDKKTFYQNTFYYCECYKGSYYEYKFNSDSENEDEIDSNDENDYFISYNNIKKMIKTLANMLIKNDKNIEFL